MGRSGNQCCAFNCNQIYDKNSGISFHSFPVDPIRRKIWIRQVRRQDFEPTKHSKLCSKHFTPDCFETEKFGGTWLKPTAIPTIFDFSSATPNCKKTILSQRLTQRERKKNDSKENELPTTETSNPGSENNESGVSGKRIVDINYFVHQLMQLNVHGAYGCSLSNMSVVSETRLGVASEISFRCSICNFEKCVWTEDTSNQSPMSCTAENTEYQNELLEEFLDALNVPTDTNTAVAEENSDQEAVVKKDGFESFIITVEGRRDRRKNGSSAESKMYEYHVTHGTIKKIVKSESNLVKNLYLPIGKAFSLDLNTPLRLQYWHDKYSDWVDCEESDEIDEDTKLNVLKNVMDLQEFNSSSSSMTQSPGMDLMYSTPSTSSFALTEPLCHLVEDDSRSSQPMHPDEFPYPYKLPQFPLWLHTALITQSTQLLEPKCRFAIINVLFDDLVRYGSYPTSRMFQETARALVEAYPILKPHNSWVVRLRDKFKKYRSRHADLCNSEEITKMKEKFGSKKGRSPADSENDSLAKHMKTLENQSVHMGPEHNLIYGSESNLMANTVTPTVMTVELDPRTLVPHDLDQQDIALPGPSSRMEPDSYMMQQHVNLSMLCDEIYPGYNPQPDLISNQTEIKPEPIDYDTDKQGYGTVAHKVDSFPKTNLFQPRTSIKGELDNSRKDS